MADMPKPSYKLQLAQGNYRDQDHQKMWHQQQFPHKPKDLLNPPDNNVNTDFNLTILGPYIN